MSCNRALKAACLLQQRCDISLIFNSLPVVGRGWYLPCFYLSIPLQALVLAASFLTPCPHTLSLSQTATKPRLTASQLMYEPCFNTLRTAQQLGYQVSTSLLASFSHCSMFRTFFQLQMWSYRCTASLSYTGVAVRCCNAHRSQRCSRHNTLKLHFKRNRQLDSCSYAHKPRFAGLQRHPPDARCAWFLPRHRIRRVQPGLP